MRYDDDTIIRKLIQYQKEIREMDLKVRQYLSDRKKYRHPFPEGLIKEIRSFENQIYMSRNTEVQLRLDSLVYSLLVHERDWKRAFEADAETPSDERVESTYQPAETTETRSDSLMDRVYRAAEKKWSQLGVGSTESREELVERLCPVYDKTREEGKEVGFVYDTKTHKVQIKIKNDDS